MPAAQTGGQGDELASGVLPGVFMRPTQSDWEIPVSEINSERRLKAQADLSRIEVLAELGAAGLNLACES